MAPPAAAAAAVGVEALPAPSQSVPQPGGSTSLLWQDLHQLLLLLLLVLLLLLLLLLGLQVVLLISPQALPCCSCLPSTPRCKYKGSRQVISIQ
jgi:hypothetical protein